MAYFNLQKRFNSQLIKKQPFQILQERGLLHYISNEKLLKENLSFSEQKKPSVYIGFDPTAESIHLGNFLGLIALTHLRLSGFFKPIILFGGATGLIGDPSGRSSERQLLSLDQIQSNINNFQSQFNILNQNIENQLIKKGLIQYKFEEITYVNNQDFYQNINSLEFLRDIGKNFRISTMLSRDSVKSRIERGSNDQSNDEGMSYTEFSYQILQAYDFYKLFQNHNCKVQIGGSDQWGNIASGIDFIRRMQCQKEIICKNGVPARQEEVYGATIPLLVDCNGKKIGKSQENGEALWLDSSKTSPFNFYQFCINIQDSLILQMLQKLTFLDMQKIQEIMDIHKKKPELRFAQNYLAQELTEMVHGSEKMIEAQNQSQILFQKDKSINQMNEEEFIKYFKDTYKIKINMNEILCNQQNVKYQGDFSSLLAHPQICLRKTKAEARRLIDQGGVSINEKRLQENKTIDRETDFIFNKYMLINVGKKQKVILELSD